MVTSGSAGAMASATAACMAGSDPKNVWQLPDTTGLRSEVVMMEGRSPFDSAIRLAGGKLSSPRRWKICVCMMIPQTAMVYTTWRDDRLERILKITKPAGVPLLVDDAAGIPPFQWFTHYAKIGVDLYCFKRRKRTVLAGMSGVLLGRKRSDRCGAVQHQSMGRRSMPPDESRQGRDHGYSCGG